MTVDSLVLSKMDKIKILPPLSLSTLTEAQLCEIIPLLVKLATGRGQAQFELAEVQPRWWPTDVPWMNPATLYQNPHLSGVTWKEMLCKIVRCCYSYSGQESLLLQQDNRTAAHGTSAVGRDKVKCDTSVVNAGSVERYLCSICIKQFESRDALQHHQEISKHTLLQNRHARSNIMPALCSPFREVHTVSDSAQILDTQETHHKDMHHNSKAVLPGLRLSKQKCRRHVKSHPSEFCSQEEFMLVCGLVTNSNASRLKHEAEETLVDLDCQIIAVEGLPNIAPLASPRSSISLMSQLSRQMTSARKSLDFAKNVEGSDNNSDSGAGAIVPAAQGSLLGIDFSSPLGQRLKKHMKTDLSVPIVSNMEKYCKTFLEKTEFLHKLRLRPLFDYPVTFKKSKKPTCAYYHTYKFNQEERREFVRTYRTGLNKRSRFLRQQMKKCFVCLKRLSGEEIKVWTLKRRTILNQEIPIDDDLSIVQVDIPESCYQAVCQQLPVITPAHHQSCAKLGCKEGVDSEVLECGAPNNLPQHSAISTHSVVPQRSQFLVKKVSKNVNGQESQKLFFVPLEETRIHSRITNPTDFCKTDHSTLQEPGKKWTEMSLGINSSKISVMPAGSRSVERRGRKQVLGYRKGIEASDFTVETCSSSDDEGAGNENQASQSHCRTDMTSALLGASASASATLCRNSVLAADKVKPSQFSHLLSTDSPQTHVSAAWGVSVGNSADQRLLTNEDNILKSQSLHSSAHVPSVAARGKAQDNRDPVSCALPSKGSRDSKSNMWARSEASGNVETVSDMRLSSYNVRGAQLSNGDVHLSIDAVYSAADLSNKQLAASLGLQFSEPLQEETREAPPNFLHSVIPPLFPMYQPQRTESSQFPLKSLQVRPTLVQHPVTPSTQPVPFFHPVLAQRLQVPPQAAPAMMANSAKHSLRFHDLPSRPQLLQQQQQNQTKQQTQPSRLISMTTHHGQQTRMFTESEGHVGKDGDAGGSQLDSASCFSAKNWKVVPVPDDDGGADDDVVEVICIDD